MNNTNKGFPSKWNDALYWLILLVVAAVMSIIFDFHTQIIVWSVCVILELTAAFLLYWIIRHNKAKEMWVYIIIILFLATVTAKLAYSISDWNLIIH